MQTDFIIATYHYYRFPVKRMPNVCVPIYTFDTFVTCMYVYICVYVCVCVGILIGLWQRFFDGHLVSQKWTKLKVKISFINLQFRIDKKRGD